MSEAIKLKPCPFCGGKAHINFASKYGILGGDPKANCIIFCSDVDCVAGLTDTYRDTGETIKTWNTRTAVNNHQKLVEALERQADNMAFVINHAELHGFYWKFLKELEEDRAALSSAKGDSNG